MKTTAEKIADLRRYEKRRQDMVKAQAQGVSLAELSRKYGISRARVWQILKSVDAR
jgi:Mor family transcriptional regulator